jgi:uncharacterized membrane protein HdeD (DUF308 family)
MVRPAVGALGLLYFVAAWAILLGVLLVAFAFKARTFANRATDSN